MPSQGIPSEIRAITIRENGTSITTIPPPELNPTRLIIKVHSVALNPTDWKHISWGKTSAHPFSIVGCDYSGTVVSIGDQVTKPFSIGDKVFGCSHGSNSDEPYDGVFADYAAVKGDVAMKVPSNLSMESVSTIALGSITVGQGLFQKGKGLGLHLPEEGKGNGEWLLIYGGSTATGSLGIQFAKLAGYKVITTCSPRNNEFVKSCGADAVFDYNEEDCGSKIRKFTDNKLKYAWDTIGPGAAAKICGEALSSDGEGCHYGTIVGNPSPREDVKYTVTIMYTMFGERFTWRGEGIPASEADYDFGKTWMDLTEKLVGEGKLKPHPAKVNDGGLEGVMKGLDELKNGNVSGAKLVYNL